MYIKSHNQYLLYNGGKNALREKHLKQYWKRLYLKNNNFARLIILIIDFKFVDIGDIVWYIFNFRESIFEIPYYGIRNINTGLSNYAEFYNLSWGLIVGE